MKSDEACRHALQRRPNDDDLEQFGLAFPRDEIAAPRDAAHERLVLQAHQRFTNRRAAHTAACGALALEVGEGQTAETAVELGALGFARVAVTRDLTGRERVVEGRWES